MRVKTQVNQSTGTYTNLLLGGNFNVEELDYGCDQDCEDEASDEDGDNESDRDGDVRADGHVPSFLTINQLMENK